MLRVYIEQRPTRVVGWEAYQEAAARGRMLKANGMRCTCRECTDKTEA